METLLQEEKFMSLYGELSNWRRVNGSGYSKPGILPFISGLRFSVRLVYIIREIIDGSSLKADWGHIIDADDSYNAYSRECDIIVYRKNAKAVVRQWNGLGEGRDIMSFKFVRQEYVEVVVSCKSFIQSGNVDAKYPGLLEGYTPRVWLFGECCILDDFDKIVEKTKQAGYEHFWHLYTWNEEDPSEPNRNGWSEFEQRLFQLVEES